MSATAANHTTSLFQIREQPALLSTRNNLLFLQEAAVQRVDPALGVLLDLAACGSGYAHISDISDERIAKLEKVLKVGQREAARVIGARPMDGLAVLSLKPSAVEQFLVVSCLRCHGKLARTSAAE